MLAVYDAGLSVQEQAVISRAMVIQLACLGVFASGCALSTVETEANDEIESLQMAIEQPIDGLDLSEDDENVRPLESPATSSTQNGKMLRVQIALQRETIVFQAISNTLKTKHDTAKNSIGNIR